MSRRERVRDGRTITLKEVALEAGVSRATVSLVLRDSPLVASPTRERVKHAIASVGYVYDRGAARLRTGVSGTIGLIVPEITNPFYAELTSGIDDTLDAAGRLTFLANSNDRIERQDRFLRRIREHGVDGILICAAEGTPASLADQLAAWRMPFVQILRTIDGMTSDVVAPDFRRGTELAVGHLFGRGHRRIALMPSIRKTSPTRERIEAFGAALRDRGLEPHAVIPCASDRAAAAGAVTHLLSTEPRPTAVVCHNDLMALGVLRAMRNLGLEPGRDLGVVGFDDIPEASNGSSELTSIATAPAQVGRAAARMLLQRISDPERPIARILIEPTLMVRGT